MASNTLDNLRNKAADLTGLAPDAFDPNCPIEELPLSDDQQSDVFTYGFEGIGGYSKKEWLDIWFASRRLPERDPTLLSLRLLAPLWARAARCLDVRNWRVLHPSLRDVSEMIDTGRPVFSSNEDELAHPPWSMTRVSILFGGLPVVAFIMLTAISAFEGRDLAQSTTQNLKATLLLTLFYPLLFARGVVATLRSSHE